MPSVDNEAPKISNLNYKYENNKIYINWENLTSNGNSPEVTYGSIDCGLTSTYGTTVKDGTALTYFNTTKQNYFSQHSFVFDADSGKKYFIRINATDPAGNTTNQTFEINTTDLLRISTISSEEQVAPGQEYIYTITIENSTDFEANNLVITNPLDPRISFVSSSSGGIYSENNVMFNSSTTPSLSKMLPNSNLVLSFKVKVN